MSWEALRLIIGFIKSTNEYEEVSNKLLGIVLDAFRLSGKSILSIETHLKIV
jgi:hypothetical protein